MIYCLLPLLILSADAAAHTASPLTQAQEVRHWDFEAGDDKNYDRWPDDWTRRRGKGYPLYLNVEIAEDETPRASGRPTDPGGQHVLRMDLDGGAALVYSPPVEVSSLFSYVLNGYIKTEGLEHDVAYAEVLFYDKDRKRLEPPQPLASPRRRYSAGWTPFQIGPAAPSSEQVRWAVIALHLAPSAKADLTGSAMFDDLWFAKLPRVSIDTNGRNNLFKRLSDVEITCHVSGISQPDPKVRFELQDVYGQTLATHEMAMQSNRPEATFAGSATWRPLLKDFGFYRVLVSMADLTSDPIATNFAVLQNFRESEQQNFRGSEQGEFGWSLPGGDDPVSLGDLVSLLEEVGVHWVKFPVRCGYEDSGHLDELAWFAERMSTRNINMVAMLVKPPQTDRDQFGEQGDKLPVASVSAERDFTQQGSDKSDRVDSPLAAAFVEPDGWHPDVDPLLTRLSPTIHWWQLGSDRDTSFVNFPSLNETPEGIRQGFNRFGQQVNVGVAWRSTDETPDPENQPWSFLSYFDKPSLTPDEIPRYMPAEPPTPAKRWMIMEPLAKPLYSLETRARDLVWRMLTAKIQQVDGIFVPDPFHAEHGLMTEAGQPDRMLLPWRTTAMMLADTTYVGSIRMPHGSSNHIFARDNQAVMVVWNEEPTDEVIYLGEKVEQVDVWGRRRRARNVEQAGVAGQEIKVTRLPTFITGVDPQIALWRMQFQFDNDKIASVFGQEQTVGYSFSNPFDQGVGGTMKLFVPDVWEASPQSATFKLSANERHRRGFRVTLQPSASSGEQPVRVDFEITASRTYKFSIYRTLDVGVGDILVDLTSRLDENGNLIVEQQLTNTTDQFVSFNCNLTTSKRRRERHQIFNRGRGTTTVLFMFPHGEELLGETMWLRVEEIDGRRILNHQIIAHE